MKKITKEEFIKQVGESHGGKPIEEILKCWSNDDLGLRFEVVECVNCDYDRCEGWRIEPNMEYFMEKVRGRK
jgi:hypothetical protein